MKTQQAHRRAGAGQASRVAGLVVAVLAGVTGLASPAAAAGGEWAPAGTMATARYDHTATLLEDGSVLVAGGVAAGPLGTSPSSAVEVSGPTPGTWRAAAPMGVPRAKHTATRLDTRCGTRCGDVLAVGGWVAGSPSSATAAVELYDADAGTWSLAAPLLTARFNHTATVLDDGRVLVAGGRGAFLTTTVEVYDPEAGTWAPTGSLNGAYYDHTATLLATGQVLVVGAASSGSAAELYDPVSGSWFPTAAPAVQRFDHTASLLADGSVLVAGTAGGTDSSGDGQSAEVYDPARQAWAATGSLSTRRAFHTASVLDDGTVLVTGGSPSASAELYDSASGSWSQTGALVTNRRDHSATVLPDGQVLAAGGRAGTTLLASAERYDPPAAAALPPVVSVGDVAVPEGHAGTRPASFAVTLSAPSPTPVSVEYAVVDGTAGADDHGTAAGTLTFAPGVTSGLIDVAVFGDTLGEADEGFTVVLAAPTGATIGDGTGAGVIVDDDPSAGHRLDIGDASVHEGDAGDRAVAVTVSLSRPRPKPVTVSYATTGGTASGPADYTPVSGTLTFAPGQTGATIVVTVHPDDVAEGAETVVVTLSDSAGGPVGDATGSVTILDDD